jgi:protein-S-isoprenylcysteine O-methyltransferase Ste14
MLASGMTRFRERWIDLLHKAATGTRKTRVLLTPVGLAVFGVFTTLFVLAALLVDSLLSLPGLLPESARLPVAIPLVAVGAAVTAWSALHFLKVKGTPVPFNPPPKVVTTGPYRYARNPMLTGVFLFLFGIGFGLGSASLVCFFTPLYVAINVWELRQIEEPELEKRLGREYLDYRRRTPMFLPGLSPRSKLSR